MFLTHDTLLFMEHFSISQSARKYPRLPYQKIKDDILGTSYTLSLVFVGAARAQKLNQTTRGKSYIPNVLSFPLDATHGEIYIAPTVAKTEAKKFNMTPNGYTGYLFIHGLLHLKGYAHGSKMETLEQKYLQKFKMK